MHLTLPLFPLALQSHQPVGKEYYTPPRGPKWTATERELSGLSFTNTPFDSAHHLCLSEWGSTVYTSTPRQTASIL